VKLLNSQIETNHNNLQDQISEIKSSSQAKINRINSALTERIKKIEKTSDNNVKLLNSLIESNHNNLQEQIHEIKSSNQSISTKITGYDGKINSIKTDTNKKMNEWFEKTYKAATQNQNSLNDNFELLSSQVENLRKVVEVIREKQNEPPPEPDLSNLPTQSDLEFLANEMEDEIDNVNNHLGQAINQLAIRLNLNTNKQFKDILAIHTTEITNQFLAYDKKIQEKISEITGNFSEKVFTPQPSVLNLKETGPILPVVWDGGENWAIQNPYLKNEIKQAYEKLGLNDIRRYLQREAKM
jgi:hypothetical protein